MLISLTVAETENCSLQKKEKILEAHRNKKACDPKINYGIYYVCVHVLVQWVRLFSDFLYIYIIIS